MAPTALQGSRTPEETGANPARKGSRTSWMFVGFLSVSLVFAASPYLLPLQDVSTADRLEASKESFFTSAKEDRLPVGSRSGEKRLPSKEDSAPHEQPDDRHRPDYHVVFSTSCSEQQNWESFVFFYHANKVQQPGSVTRIASGCTAQQAKEQTDFFNRYIHPMSGHHNNATSTSSTTTTTTTTTTGSSLRSFHLHLTPDYGSIQLAKGRYYKYMNKPFGLRHWMEHALGLRADTMQATDRRVEDGIVILMDPDQILLRPILHDFSDVDNHLWAKKKSEQPATLRVRHGYPMAQQDGYLSNQWMSLDAAHITNQTEGNYIPMPKSEDGPLHFNTGPPYLATVRDMYRIAVRWCEYAPRVVDIHPELFAEMYGFIHATVQLELPFTLIQSLVVSVTTTPHREGWKYIDDLPEDQVCDPPSTALLPIALHYCKRYALGKWFFSKYRVKKSIMKCETGLLRPPPVDLATQKLDYAIFPPRADFKDKDSYVEKKEPIQSLRQAKREAFMLCALTRTVNEALRYHKRLACGDDGNYVANYTVHDDPSNY